MEYTNPHGPGCPWHAITESQGAPNVKWCEENLCQWITEPANTWSNLGYLIVGLMLILIAFRGKHNFQLKQFGPIIFFMGAMSYFFHMSNFYLSQLMDFVGMFFFVGWALGMNFIRLGVLKKKHLILFNAIWGLILTGVMHILYLEGLKFQALILITGFVIIGTEVKAYRMKKVDEKWFIASIVILVTAFSFQILDAKRLWCDPSAHGWFSQGHAVWHWIASLAMFTLYKHFSQPLLEPQKDT